YGLFSITVLTAVYALQFSDTKRRRDTVTQYAVMALEHCADLVNEAQRLRFDPKTIWTMGDPLADFDVMWERRRLVGDCAAISILAAEDSAGIDKTYASEVLRESFFSP